MSDQYNRKYRLVITSIDGDSKTIEDLRVSFEVTKSILSFPNLCRLSIYNPNEETFSILSSKYSTISLEAGYYGNMRLLFKGEVRNILRSRDGINSILTVFAGDGEQDWQNSTINKTLSQSISVRSAVEEVLKTFKNTSVGVIEGLPLSSDKIRGQVLSGSSKDVLDTFADEYGFNWSIDDGEINIVPKDSVLEPDDVIVISSDTGMVNSPTITEIGVDVTCLLNPRLTPNRAFKITSPNADTEIGNLFFREIKRTTGEGSYKIQESLFKGDSYEGDWLVTVKGISL